MYGTGIHTVKINKKGRCKQQQPLHLVEAPSFLFTVMNRGKRAKLARLADKNGRAEGVTIKHDFHLLPFTFLTKAEKTFDDADVFVQFNYRIVLFSRPFLFGMLHIEKF